MKNVVHDQFVLHWLWNLGGDLTLVGPLMTQMLQKGATTNVKGSLTWISLYIENPSSGENLQRSWTLWALDSAFSWTANFSSSCIPVSSSNTPERSLLHRGHLAPLLPAAWLRLACSGMWVDAPSFSIKFLKSALCAFRSKLLCKCEILSFLLF